MPDYVTITGKSVAHLLDRARLSRSESKVAEHALSSLLFLAPCVLGLHLLLFHLMSDLNLSLSIHKLPPDVVVRPQMSGPVVDGEAHTAGLAVSLGTLQHIAHAVPSGCLRPPRMFVSIVAAKIA